ncbi:MAG: hypothetical protein ACLFVU_06700 [Phycisphaerae bacterium]
MTSLASHVGVQQVRRRLAMLRMRRWGLDLLTGLVSFTAVILGGLVLTGASLGYWPDQPPTLLRWTVLLVFIAMAAAAAAWWLALPLFRRPNLHQTARFAESRLPDLRNDLINTLLLSTDNRQASEVLVRQAIEEAAQRVQSVDLARSLSTRTLRRRFIAAAVCGASLVAFTLLQPAALSAGLQAAFAPGSYLQARNHIRLLELTPGDATAFAGQQLVISARIANPDATDRTARVVVTGDPTPLPMTANPARTEFTCTIPSVTDSFDYRVEIGESRWPVDRPSFHVEVVQEVEVRGIDLQYTFPEYTGLEPHTVSNAPGAIEAPVGSMATVSVRLARPVARGRLRVQGAAAIPMQPGPAGELSAEVAVVEDGAYAIELFDSSGRLLKRLPDDRSPAASTVDGTFPIRAIPDAKPRIEIVSPGRDVTLAPGRDLPLRIRVFDAYGITRVDLFAGKEGERPRKVEGFPTDRATGRKGLTFEYALAIPAERYSLGDEVIYYATVTDNRDLEDIGLGGPQTTAGHRFKIFCQDPEQLARRRARLYEQLRRRLMAMLERQVRLRVDTGVCVTRHTKLEQVTATATAVRTGQTELLAETKDLVDNFAFDKDTIAVQQALEAMKTNEAPLAVEQAAVLAQLADFNERRAPAAQLARTQDSIIQTLQTLLAVMPSLADRAKQDSRSATGEDLSPEQQEKLQQLKNAMQQLAEQQRKAVETTRRLQKKPVDDFSAADEEQLKKLLSNADEWEKFINEKFADLSKLAQQDFANPAMLKELVAIKCDITMQADALAKKAIEIATAAEENGIENAESLTANIEKWLPDEPDRKKWTMEDPDGDQMNLEHAELPKELEDLVGDLLEEEEDLFEQADDQNSKAAMSGDKGIGWDAVDGPIDNMNAQGVTGNQLPNTDEKGGRSAEGRTGKSSGEFVEDKAVGKGGRRTPSRLTPEPFQKGTVNDQSKDAPGGATGGGKLSGAGGEGLEGPVPPELKKEMPRLAAKQAALINRAERIAAQFQASDYANFKFLQSIILMKRVESDLRNNRYVNALRTHKQAVGSLRQSRLMLSGSVDVTADTSAQMPKYLRKDIADAMQGNHPAEYADAMREYLKRLGGATE